MALLVMTLAACGFCSPDAPTVTLPSNPGGTLMGRWTSPLVRAFLGVPFAAPPTKDLRWRPPQPAAAWTGKKNATSNAPNCLQPLFSKTSKMTPGTVVNDGKTAAWPSLYPVTSEDCLYLNVFAPPAPVKQDAPKYSVMFYVSGGQYQFGGAHDNELDGTYTVELGRDVIVVVANSRLGPLGYLGGEALRSRDPRGSTGNYGMLDTRAALQWVKQNAVAFHGDPDKVMVFGESGGAGAVTNTLMMPANWGLFNRVLMESGAFAQWNTMTMSQAQANYDVLVKKTGCSGQSAADGSQVQCLVDASAEEIFNTVGWDSTAPPIQNGYWSCEWSPTVDGVELTAMPMELLEQGKMPPGVNVAFGSNKDEGTSFATACSVPTSKIETTCVNEYSPQYPEYVLKTGGHWTMEEKLQYRAAMPRSVKDAHPLHDNSVFPLGDMLPTMANMEMLSLWTVNNFGVAYLGGALEALYRAKASYFIDADVTEHFQIGQHMAGDFSITCPTIRAAKLLAHWHREDPTVVNNAYMYWFTHTPVMARLLSTPGVKFEGACHGCEIPFAWATPVYLSGQAEYALAAVMSGFWRAFSHSGDPNVAPEKPPLPPGVTPEDTQLEQRFTTAREEHFGATGVPLWPSYDLEARKNIWFRASEITQQSDLHAARCEFWDSWMRGKSMPGFSLDVNLPAPIVVEVPNEVTISWIDMTIIISMATTIIVLVAVLIWMFMRMQTHAGTGENTLLRTMGPSEQYTTTTSGSQTPRYDHLTC